MRRYLLAVLAVCAASPASAKVVAVSDAGFVVRASAEVTASPQDAWKELIVPADWWNKAHTFSGDSANLYLDSQATGCFCEKLFAPKGVQDQRPGSVEHMRIVYVDPGKALRMVGGLGPLQSEAASGTLTITLKPGGGRTRILWEYVVGGYMRYKPEEIAPAVDKVLGEQLASLASKLGPVAPPPTAKGKAGGKSKAAPKPAETEVPAVESDEPASIEVPAEPQVEEPKASPVKPTRPGRRQPKPDDEYIEPTR